MTNGKNLVNYDVMQRRRPLHIICDSRRCQPPSSPHPTPQQLAIFGGMTPGPPLLLHQYRGPLSGSLFKPPPLL